MASDIKKKHLGKRRSSFPTLPHSQKEKKDRKGGRKGQGDKRRRKEKGEKEE